MKHFKMVSLYMWMTITLITGIAACSTRTTRIQKVEPLSQPTEQVIVRFDRTFSFKGCTPRRGICIEWYQDKESWVKHSLQPNEMRGRVWATKTGNDSSSINCRIEQQKLPRELYKELVLNRVLTIEEDTYIPQDLVVSAYRNARIKNVPSEIRIAKGKYPVVVGNPPKTSESGNLFVITVTFTVTVKVGDWIITATITIEVEVDP